MTLPARSDKDALEAIAEMEKNRETVCDHAGHEWADAGGGMLICMVCMAEEWGDPRD